MGDFYFCPSKIIPVAGPAPLSPPGSSIISHNNDTTQLLIVISDLHGLHFCLIIIIKIDITHFSQKVVKTIFIQVG